jgi:hypothetical protein
VSNWTQTDQKPEGGFKVEKDKRSEVKVQMLGKKVPKLGKNVGSALAYEG